MPAFAYLSMISLSRRMSSTLVSMRISRSSFFSIRRSSIFSQRSLSKVGVSSAIMATSTPYLVFKYSSSDTKFSGLLALHFSFQNNLWEQNVHFCVQPLDELTTASVEFFLVLNE